MLRHAFRHRRTAPGSLLLVALFLACADGRPTSEEWSGASDTTATATSSASASADASFPAPASAAPIAPPPPPPMPSSVMRRERAAIGNQALSLGGAVAGSVAGGAASGSAGGAAVPGFEGSSAQASASQGTAATPAMIIRSGTAAVRVDSLEPAMAALRAMTARLGGFVGSAAQYAGERQARSAMLELKLPAERFEEAIAGLEPLGRVESIHTSAQDVGEEFVDMSARMANAERLEARLVELLARRTGRLEDVLAVERELARVREEIERYEGRLRYLRSRVALSTLTVTISEPVPLLAGQPGPSPIGEAVREAWRNAVRVVAAMIATFGALAPLAVVAAVIALVIRRVVLRRRAHANRQRPASVAPAAS